MLLFVRFGNALDGSSPRISTINFERQSYNYLFNNSLFLVSI